MVDRGSTAVMEALQAKYCYPAFAYFQELRDCTGFHGTRSADAIALGLWPGRGLNLNSFEVKITRSDWLNELKRPEKSEVFIAECDFWWAVAPRGVINANEVPGPWGYLELRGQKLYTVKSAPKLKPRPIGRGLLASLLNRAFKSAGEAPRKELEEAREQGAKREAERAMHDRDSNRERLADLQHVVAEFEKASGIRLNSWRNGRELGEAVELVLRHQPKLIARVAYRAAQVLREKVGEMERLEQQLTELLKPLGVGEKDEGGQDGG